ncbi:hypothetical protein [Pararobbsia alpina]|uniref:Uncharacterized protein n=1 Tax=Pararobbsia alpina TaxID=621374 RepID=A0A6S7B7Q2_9BURK|nr:hypothetical protein [Pararobbsia alpina]CAB3790085.1 hypothetical protein LMG28138_02914 [Pararobbsia alpina]
MDTSTKTEDSNSFDELIYKRELNEVYLLLDFISGRPEVHIGGLDLKISKGSTDEVLSTFDAVLHICKLGYPPDPLPLNRAADAALLLLVKDKLSSLAYPARGMTIAYTYCFIEPAGSLMFPNIGKRELKTEDGKRQTRISIAREAYPGLYLSARRFRTLHKRMTGGSVFLTFIAAALLWMVAYGVQVTARFEDDRKRDADVTAKIYAEVNVQDAALQSRPQSQLSAEKRCRDEIAAQSNEVALLCNEWSYVQARYAKTIADACTFATHLPSSLLMLPFPSEVGRERLGCRRRPEGATSSGQSDRSNDAEPDAYAAQEDIQSITLVLSTYSNYVLPILFGLVGTAASMIRSVGDKIRDCVLAPRDEALAFVRLPLGLMAGVAVGLFFSPTSVAQSISSGAASTLTITASGVAFLAGYGSEGFFRLVDMLIDHIFSFGRNGNTTPVK